MPSFINQAQADIVAQLQQQQDQQAAANSAMQQQMAEYYASIANDPSRSPEERQAAAKAAHDLYSSPEAATWGEVYSSRQQGMDARAQQDALAQEMWARIHGDRDSLAQQQLRSATDANIRAQQSAAASAGAGGFGEALAHRQAAFGAAQSRQQQAGQAAELRAQEEATNVAQLAELTGQQREQDLSRQGLESSSILGQKDAVRQDAALREQANSSSWDRWTKLAGAGLTAGATIGGAMIAGPLGAAAGAGAGSALSDAATSDDPKTGSDPKLKKDITPAWGKAGEWLDEVSPVEYRYRDPDMQASHGRIGEDGVAHIPVQWMQQSDAGRKLLGVLTSDLERTPEGAQMVIQTPRGKAIDPAAAMSPIIASLAEINARLARLEKGGK